ncbi:substrate-binding domain-containing protein [Streptomyces sp. TRM75563]|nr:substrate-binding domain-containing protein [Streptomyces sp. TRM75563]MCI4042001.1 substrate-binding domain-containing protein [Streptomyces sp. TRM75563]
MPAAARPDAVFRFSDVLAFGARGVLYEAGLDVPEDVAPAGVDGSGEALHTTCSLTSVAARQGGHRRVGRRLPGCPDRRRGPPAGRRPHRTAPAGGTEFTDGVRRPRPG